MDIKIKKLNKAKSIGALAMAAIMGASTLTLNVNAAEAQTIMTAQTGSEQAQQEEFKAKEFIIDTDFSSDVDDAVAISTAMYYQDMGLINVRGVALCVGSARAGWAMSSLLGAHKYWDIPICVDWDDELAIGSKYHLNMSSNYPHKENQFTDAVSFYRMMIASSTEPVNIVTLGQLINLDALLKSGPDAHSPLTGEQLIAEKVDTLYVCGTKYSGKAENNLFYAGENYGNNKWYNTSGVTEAAINIAKKWTSRVVWIPSEVGGLFNVGGNLVQHDRGKTDILANALRDYEMPNGCMAFDPMVIYVAVNDATGTLAEKGLAMETGTMKIYGGGGSAFELKNPQMNHERVQKLLPDNQYMGEINSILDFEYYKRHPEQAPKAE